MVKIGGDTKKYYEQETEKARLEMIKTIQDRDKVTSEVKEQRVALNKLSNSINKSGNKVGNLLFLIKGLNKEYKISKNIFGKISKSEAKVITEFSLKTQELLNVKNNITKKESRDIKLDKKITGLELKIKELDNNLRKKIKEKEGLIIFIDRENEKLEDKQLKFGLEVLKLTDKARKLNKEEKRLVLKEKRLSDLKKDLFYKK